MTDTTNLADRLEAFIPRGDGYNSDYANTLTEAVEALRSVQSAQVQGDGWIPVGERLPEYGQEVIVNSNFDGVCAGVLDSYDEWFAPCSEYKLTRITHWMPLPAAPGAASSAPKADDPVKQMMLEALEMLETTCELGLGYDHAIRQVARAAIAAARQGE